MTPPFPIRPRVYFRDFADLERRRVEMSNAVWAILVGSKMAANTLTLTQGSQRTLAEMFPTVQHIGRFNLRTEDARSLLDDAERELCVMGMSHAIAVHEDFVKTCLSWLVPLGKLSQGQLKQAKTANIHELMGTASGRNIRATTLSLFHLTRLMRNCHIHSGGTASSTLEAFMDGMTRTQRNEWVLLTREPFKVIAESEFVDVGVPEMIATLAVGKRLAYEVNLCLQRAIPRRAWADRAAADYFSVLGSKPPQDPAALKALVRYSNTHFSPIRLSEHSLETARRKIVDKKKRTLFP